MAKKRDCPRHFPLFPFVVRSCHKHSFLHASFFCLAVSARNLTVPVIPLSISFRLFLISRAFLFVCPTCLSPRQRLRRVRAFFRFLPFHAAFGERDAPWLFTLYCPRPVARFFLPVASPPRAFFLLVSFLCLAVSAKSLSVSVISLSISFRLSRESRAFPSACSTCLSPMQRVRGGRALFSFPPVLCRLVRTRSPLASFTIWLRRLSLRQERGAGFVKKPPPPLH